jgi:transposase-like protein
MTDREMGKPCMLKPIKENSVSVRRKFDPTFKREAVQNWLASGKSAEVVAKELGILANRLYAWRKRFAPVDAGGKAATGAKPGSYADLQVQLDVALRENRHLREQRDILKKTLGILSEPSTNALPGLTR